MAKSQNWKPYDIVRAKKNNNKNNIGIDFSDK